MIAARPVTLPAMVMLAASALGCATLTVDVDVYKGPLVSEDLDLQTQRLFGVIDSSKPLMHGLDVVRFRYPFPPATDEAYRRAKAGLDAIDRARSDYLDSITYFRGQAVGVNERSCSFYKPESGRTPDDTLPGWIVCEKRIALIDAVVRYADNLLTLATLGRVGASANLVLHPHIRSEVTAYLRGLEAVGNSLEAVANEIQRRGDSQILQTALLRDTEWTEAERVIEALSPKTPREAEEHKLDTRTAIARLITHLEYERMRVLANGETGESFAKAIEAAQGRRQRMTDLKPASAYLRTSASTLLHMPKHLESHNMLDDQLLRLVPDWAFGAWDALFDPVGGYRALEAIDQHSWQSINRVRVTGIGRINYAVAKDDLGNWYVKGYSTNVEDIVNSARSLAMYGMGASMGADLLNLATTSDGETQPGIDAAEATKASSEESLAARYRKVFNEQTDTDWAAWKTAIETLKSRLAARLSERFPETPDMVEPLDDIRTIPADEGEDPPDIFVSGARLKAAIASLDDFRASAISFVSEQTVVPARATLEAAREELRVAEEAAAATPSPVSESGEAEAPVQAPQLEAAKMKVAEATSTLSAAENLRAFCVHILASETRAVALEATKGRLRTVGDYRNAVSVLGNVSP